MVGRKNSSDPFSSPESFAADGNRIVNRGRVWAKSNYLVASRIPKER